MHDYWFKKHALCALILCIGSVITVNGCNDVSNAPPPPTGPTGLTVTTTALPPATINQPYAATVSATGGVTPYSWSVSPALPANVALDAGTGAINGIPAAQGASNHTFTVQDSSNPPKTSQRLLTFNVPGAPSITTTSLPPGTVNSPYPPTTLTAAGGLPPLVWQPAAMPFGLTFDPGTQTILGTPLSAGSQNVTFTVRDSSVPLNQTGSATLNLTVNAALTINNSSPLPGGTLNQPYGPVTLTASGGAPPYSWSILGGTAPAPGLSMTAGGIITGTPSAAGSFTNTYRLQDSNGIVATKPLGMTIATLVITTPSPLPNGKELFLYTGLNPLVTMSASGGTPGYTWSASGLPTGLTMSSSGQVTGIPALGTSVASPYAVVISATDSAGLSVSQTFSLTITP